MNNSLEQGDIVIYLGEHECKNEPIAVLRNALHDKLQMNTEYEVEQIDYNLGTHYPIRLKGKNYFHPESIFKFVRRKEIEGLMSSPYDDEDLDNAPKTVTPIIINSTKEFIGIPKENHKENKAMRFNSDRLKVSLIHNASLEPLVKVLEFGCKKYSRNNWMNSMDKLEILESLKRHVDELIDKVNSGESELDSDSGEHIIGHIFSNAMFYSYHNVINK